LGYVAETFASAEEYLGSNRVADTACLISDIQIVCTENLNSDVVTIESAKDRI
jgi:hypothetical protein